jgi:hypothetical protein
MPRPWSNPPVARSGLMVLMLILAWARPAFAEPGRWGFGGGAALVEGYASGWSDGFDGTAFPYLSVEHWSGGALWLRGEAGYQGFRSGSGISAHEADWVPIGIGFRLQKVTPVGIGAYFEFYPTLYFLRWLDHPGYDYAGLGAVREWRGIVPGYMSGLGLQVQAGQSITIDYGLRFHRSLRPADDLHPLRQDGFGVGINWRPAH